MLEYLKHFIETKHFDNDVVEKSHKEKRFVRRKTGKTFMQYFTVADSEIQVNMTSYQKQYNRIDAKQIAEDMKKLKLDIQQNLHVNTLSTYIERGSWRDWTTNLPDKEASWRFSIELADVNDRQEAVELMRIVAQHAKEYQQDAALVKGNVPGAVDTYNTVVTFKSKIEQEKRDVIDACMVELGFAGWSWLRSGNTVGLHVTHVPQWDDDEQGYLKKVSTITSALKQIGVDVDVQMQRTKVAVLENNKDSQYYYDNYINRKVA